MSETRTVDVLDASGAKAGTTDLPAELFDVTANIPLIHQVVVAQLAAARQGSTRAPQFVGGGVVHGPQPHGYAQRTPKKMIAAALRGALSDRARDGRVHVVTDLVLGDTPSTKTALAALATVATSPKVLVVLHRDDDLAWLSLRNAADVHAIAVDQLNAYDVLVNDEVVFTASALDAYVAGPPTGRSAKAVATESEAEGYEPTNDELAATAAPAAEVSEPLENLEPLEVAEPVEVIEPEAEGDLK